MVEALNLNSFDTRSERAASFLMVKAMRGNDRLAANIVALTTRVVSVTVTIGVFVLRRTGFVISVWDV